MKYIIGYINIFKNKTGFCIPVFDIEGDLWVQNGDDLMKPHSNMLIEDQTFYRLKKKIGVRLDFKKDVISLFIYDKGENFQLIKKSNPFSIFEIRRNNLDRDELKELDTVINSLENNPNIINYTNKLKSRQLPAYQLDSLFKGIFGNFSFHKRHSLVENLYHISLINSKAHLADLICIDASLDKEDLIVEKAIQSLDDLKNQRLVNKPKKMARVYLAMEDSLKTCEFSEFQKRKFRGFVNRNKKYNRRNLHTKEIETSENTILNLVSPDVKGLWEAHSLFRQSKKTKNKGTYNV